MENEGKHISEQSRKRIRRTAVIVIAAVLLVLAGSAYYYFNHFYGLLNTSGETPQGNASGFLDDLTGDMTEEERTAFENEVNTDLQQEVAEEILSSDKVYNILLIGLDSREDNMDIPSRSDTMMLISINKETKTIWMTSFLRDTQVTLPDWGTGHLNWATSIGGVDMLLATIEDERNFAIQVDNWALVNFFDFVEVAEMIGSVTVELNIEEINDINYYIGKTALLMDREAKLLPYEAGTYELTDGVQILCFARERHVGGDNARAARQREVISQMFDRVKKMSLNDQLKLLEKALPHVMTDMTAEECSSLLISGAAYKNYEIKQQQIPVDGSYWAGRDSRDAFIFNIDFKVNRNFLRATIYNEDIAPEDLTSSWSGDPVLVWEPEAGEN